jgi:hydrogenase expression/formation protein HypE
VSDVEEREVREFALRCPVPLPPGAQVLLGHGSGGKLTQQLIRDLFVPALGADPELARMGDAAVLPLPDGSRLAFTTDAFVVTPAFFPGSNIGELAVNGTVNDLAMMGAEPLALSAALILEEGLAMDRLGAVVTSMADACERAGVRLVTGDTKVVERGAADGLYITTSGVGLIPEGVDVGPERAQPGDRILVTGPIGSHGVAVMSRRAGIAFETDVVSDSAPLTSLVRGMLDARRRGERPERARRGELGIDDRHRRRRPGPPGRVRGVRDARARPLVRGERGRRGGHRRARRRRCDRRCGARGSAGRAGRRYRRGR